MNIVHDKDAALDKALDLFWRKGYAATSLKDLERALGMHPGSIYAAFGSKAKLFCRVMERYVAWVSAARDAATTQAETVLDGLADFVETAHPVANPDAPLPVCFLVKTTLETGADDAEIQDRLNALLDENDRLFEQSFETAISRGELSPEQSPADLAAQLNAALAGLCYHALRGKDRAVGRKMAKDLADRLRAAAHRGPAVPGLLI